MNPNAMRPGENGRNRGSVEAFPSEEVRMQMLAAPLNNGLNHQQLVNSMQIPQNGIQQQQQQQTQGELSMWNNFMSDVIFPSSLTDPR